MHAVPRLVTAEHPTERKRRDGFWIVGGRVADWGPLPTRKAELRKRARAALSAAPDPHAPMAARDVDEVRIVSAWIAEHEPSSGRWPNAPPASRPPHPPLYPRCVDVDHAPGLTLAAGQCVV